MTPANLAIFYIAIAILPFCISAIGFGIAKLLRCKINAAGTDKCYIFNIEIGQILYFLMMFNVIGMMTFIAAFFGLIIAAIWGILSFIF
jgi:hypothetical protein